MATVHGQRAPSAEGLLGPLEYGVMRAVWAGAPASVATVLERLNARRPVDEPLAYTTAMTVLVRLHAKGYLDRVKVGRGFDYTPRFTESELVAHLGQQEVAQLMQRYGSTVALAQFAAALRDADPALLRRLASVAEADDSGA